MAAGSIVGKISKATNAAFFAAFAACLCASSSPATPLLYGHVNEDGAAPSAATLQANVVQQAPPVVATHQEKRSPVSRFQGTWQAITVVTDSLVPTVSAGQRVVSTMEFAQSNDGHLYAKWEQPGWRESQASVTVTSPDSFMIDRTSYYFGDRSGSWATRSRDSYNLLEGNKVLATSEIDQYIDGRYVGRYCTRSVLLKISDSTSVALRP